MKETDNKGDVGSYSENSSPVFKRETSRFKRGTKSSSSLTDHSHKSKRKESTSQIWKLADKFDTNLSECNNSFRKHYGNNLPKLSMDNISIVRKTPSQCSFDQPFGLSHNLSTESMKKACGFRDDNFSDDDFIEVQSIPDRFRRNSQGPSFINSFNRNSLKKNKRKKEGSVADADLPVNRCETDTSHSSFTNEALVDDADCILNELDNFLEIHDTETRVEDCLLDLDNYLEELDDCSIINGEDEKLNTENINMKRLHSLSNSRSQTLPTRGIKMSNKHNFEEPDTIQGTNFQRCDNLRKTMNYTSEGCRGPSINSSRIPIEYTESILDPISPSVSSHINMSHSEIDTSTKYDNDTVLSLRPASEDGLVQSDMRETLLGSLMNHSPNAELRRCFSQNRITMSNSSGLLTPDNIFQNILAQNGENDNLINRPRQLGRRAEGHPGILSLCSGGGGGNSNCTIINHNQRPLSAPAAASRHLEQRPLAVGRNSSLYAGSDASSARSSRNASPVSISSSDSSCTTVSTNGNIETNLVVSDHLEQSSTTRDNAQADVPPGFNNQWPHSFSRTLALFCCTVGLFNVCRFAVLTIQYGGNFLLQFLLLSLIFGIPLFMLNMCLGFKIKAGPVSMWKISPICRGIGIALVMVQCFVAIYSTVSLAWLLVYFRDSFPSKSHATYRWQEVVNPFRLATNGSSNVTQRVPDYFNIIVLQRLQLINSGDTVDVRFRVNDRLAFNLSMIWISVFTILCKGLKSFGKVVLPLTVLSLGCLITVTIKLLYIVDLSKLKNVFSSNDFDDFLVNSKTWTAAAQEAFLTWGMLGPSVISVTSRVYGSRNSKTSLRRDAILVIVMTLLSLCVAALLGIVCAQVLSEHSYVYIPGSFEFPETSTSVYSLEALPNSGILSYPSKWVPHYSSFVGETYRRHLQSSHRESGYQALRFITELFPTVLYLTDRTVSWAWGAVAFLSFILLGLAQLCVIWKPISSALDNSTSSVLLSCVTALLLGIPFTTEVGLYAFYYMDLLLGAAWFVPILWTAQILGVFLIRSRPYNGDDLVNDLKMSNLLSAFMALSWNVLLPIGLITLSIIEYKISLSNQFYYWRGKSYFNYWTRKIAGLVQISFLLLIPITAIIQIYRYLTSGPPDILDRIQLLYRPLENTPESPQDTRIDPRQRRGNGEGTEAGTNVISGDLNGYRAQDDAPPKYTPPPSYTTATGARIAKMLRQSIRRSMRRILGVAAQDRSTLGIDVARDQHSMPPEYSINPSGSNEIHNESRFDMMPTAGQMNASTGMLRVMTLGRAVTKQHQKNFNANTLRSPSTSHTLQRNINSQSLFNAEDVVSVLRSSTRLRPETITSPGTSCVRENHEMHPQHDTSFRSIENLILNAEPFGRSAAIATSNPDESQNNTSVI